MNTCNGYLRVLRRMVGALPKSLCKLFYVSIIRSQLEFASGLLCPVAKTHLDKLDIIQRKAARIICKTASDSHAEPLLDCLGLQSLHDRRRKHVAKSVSEILSNKCHPSLTNMFMFNLEDSDDESELQVPATNTQMGRKRFGVFGAEIFNGHLSSF